MMLPLILLCVAYLAWSRYRAVRAAADTHARMANYNPILELEIEAFKANRRDRERERRTGS